MVRGALGLGKNMFTLSRSLCDTTQYAKGHERGGRYEIRFLPFFWLMTSSADLRCDWTGKTIMLDDEPKGHA